MRARRDSRGRRGRVRRGDVASDARERMRFVFGIDGGDGATEAEAGVAEDDANGDADDEIADAGADAAEST